MLREQSICIAREGKPRPIGKSAAAPSVMHDCIFVEVEVMVPEGRDGENVRQDLRKCIQKWSRRIVRRGGSKVAHYVKLIR